MSQDAVPNEQQEFRTEQDKVEENSEYSNNVEKPVEILPTEITAEVSVDIPADVPVEAPAEVPVEDPAEIPFEIPIEVPAEVPAEVPSEVPAEVPTEVPAEVPAEAPVEAPAEAPAEVPAEIPAETSTEFPTEVPEEVPVEAPAEVLAETPAEVPAETPAEVPTEAPEEVPTEIPAEVLPEDLNEVNAEVHEESGDSVEIPEAIVETIPTEMAEDNLVDAVSDRDVTEPPDDTNHSVSEDKNVVEKEIKNDITAENTQDDEISKPEKVEIIVAEMVTEEQQIEPLKNSHDLPQSDEINEKIEEKSNVEAVELDQNEVVSSSLEVNEKVDNAGDQSLENNHEDIESTIDSNENSKENDAIKECTETVPNSSQTVTDTVTDTVTETKEQSPVSMVAHTVNSDETSSQKLVIGVTEDDKIENCSASVTSTENSTTIISVTTTTTSTTTSKLLESEPKSEVTVTNDSSEAKFVTCIDIKSQECEKIKKAAPVPPARTKKVESTPATEQKEPIAAAGAAAADVPKTPILHQQTVQPEATGLLAYIRNFFSCMTSKK